MFFIFQKHFFVGEPSKDTTLGIFNTLLNNIFYTKFWNKVKNVSTPRKTHNYNEFVCSK